MAAKLLSDEIEIYKSKTKLSCELNKEACKTLPLGISSCYQCLDPYPYYIASGDKNYVVDVDGNKLIDYHGGFGVTLFGYKHPLLQAAAIKVFSEQGFLVSVPTPSLVDVSKLLVSNFNLPYWRLLNSGTEATLDAIRLGRAKNNRPYVIKIESGYHGHHDAAWVSGIIIITINYILINYYLIIIYC